MKQLRIKRVYQEAAEDDGYRILTDRLWPRGVAKNKAAIDEWAKEMAPSTESRVWFGHRPERFAEFAGRYTAELDANPAAPEFVERCRRLLLSTNVTLLYGARDEVHNHAIVLQQWMKKLITHHSSGTTDKP